MPLSPFYGNVDVTGAYEQAKARNQAADMGRLKLGLTLQQILQEQAYKQQALQQQALDRAAQRESAAMNLRAQLEGRASEGAATRANQAAMLQDRLRAEAELKRQMAEGQSSLQRELASGREQTQRDIAAGQQQTQRDIAAMRQENSPAALKERDKVEGKKSTTELLNELESDYQNLEKLGSDISPKRSGISNIYNRLSSSGVGQLVAGGVGTESQAVRDSINTKRASLMASIKQATGMGATQLNSNVELQFYLKMATDPTMSREANKKAISWLRNTYGTKGENTPVQAFREGQTATGPNGQKIIFKGGQWVPISQ